MSQRNAFGKIKQFKGENKLETYRAIYKIYKIIMTYRVFSVTLTFSWMYRLFLRRINPSESWKGWFDTGDWDLIRIHMQLIDITSSNESYTANNDG